MTQQTRDMRRARTSGGIATADGRFARWGGGFSLVEIVMAVMVIGVMFVAVMNTVGAARTTLTNLGQRTQAAALAEDLLHEILAQAYRDPDAPDSFGPTDGEAATGDRSLFNDVDDYHGWSASPPEDRYGNALRGVDRLERSVSVSWADPETLGEAEYDTGVKRITVTVSRGERPLAQLHALRTDGLLREDGS